MYIPQIQTRIPTLKLQSRSSQIANELRFIGEARMLSQRIEEDFGDRPEVLKLRLLELGRDGIG